MSSIVKVLKKVTITFLVGNTSNNIIDSIHGEARANKSTVLNRSKINVAMNAEVKQQNESSMNVPEDRTTRQKTVIDRIVEIKDVTDFMRIMVNSIKLCFRQFETMKDKGSPHLFRTQTMNFIVFVRGKFGSWQKPCEVSPWSISCCFTFGTRVITRLQRLPPVFRTL